MSSENYIVINGEKRQLSEEQLKALGIKIKKNPFERVFLENKYFHIADNGMIVGLRERRDDMDERLYQSSNYFNSIPFAQQVSLHQLLYRKLLKFAWDNDAEDDEWNGNNEHYYICYDYHQHRFYVGMLLNFKSADVLFSKKDVAQRAIKEVIEPFMEVNSEFIW